MDFFQLFVGDVGIDLGSGDRGVAKHRLDASNIGAISEQIGGKAVAEGMGVDVFQDTGFGGIVLDDAGDTAGGQAERLAPAIFSVDESFLGIGDKKGRIDIAAAVERGLESRFCFGRDEDDTELSAFAPDAEFFFFEVDMAPIEADQLRNAEAGRKQQFENGSVP